MKNIWKLLMVAMLAISLVGCPQENKSDDDDTTTNQGGQQGGGQQGGGGTTVTTLPAIPAWSGDTEAVDKDDIPFDSDDTLFEGVYSYTGKIEKIGKGWGGNSASPAFSVILLDSVAEEYLVGGGTDFKNLAIGSAVYQIQSHDNNTFLTAVSGNWTTKYTGVGAVVDTEEGTYTIYVDPTKLKKGGFKGIGKEWNTLKADGTIDKEGEKVLTAEDHVNLSEYSPYLLAMDDETTDSDGNPKADFVGNMWSAYLMKMSKTNDLYPAVVKPKKVTCHVNIKGPMYIDSQDKDEFPDSTADVDWKLTFVQYYENAKIPFTFYCGMVSVTTTEVATHGATLTVNMPTNQDFADGAKFSNWEAKEVKTSNDPPASSIVKDRYIPKKLSLAGVGTWIGFDTTDDTFDCSGISF